MNIGSTRGLVVNTGGSTGALVVNWSDLVSWAGLTVLELHVPSDGTTRMILHSSCRREDLMFRVVLTFLTPGLVRPVGTVVCPVALQLLPDAAFVPAGELSCFTRLCGGKRSPDWYHCKHSPSAPVDPDCI